MNKHVVVILNFLLIASSTYAMQDDQHRLSLNKKTFDGRQFLKSQKVNTSLVAQQAKKVQQRRVTQKFFSQTLTPPTMVMLMFVFVGLVQPVKAAACVGRENDPFCIGSAWEPAVAGNLLRWDQQHNAYDRNGPVVAHF